MKLEIGLSGWTLIEEKLWGEEIYASRNVEGVQRLISQGKIGLPNAEVCPMQNLIYQCDRYQMQNDWLAASISAHVDDMSYYGYDFGLDSTLPNIDLERFKSPKLYHHNDFLSCLGYHYDDEFWERD